MVDKNYEKKLEEINDQPFSGFAAIPGSIKAMIEGALHFQFQYRQWIIERNIEYWQQEARETEGAITQESVHQIFIEEKKKLLEDTPGLQEDKELDEYLEELEKKVSEALADYSEGMHQLGAEMRSVAKELGYGEEHIGSLLAVIELSYWDSHPVLKAICHSTEYYRQLQETANLLPSPLVGATQIVPQLTPSNRYTDKEEEEKQLKIQQAVEDDKQDKDALKTLWRDLFPQIKNPSEKLLTLFDIGIKGVAKHSTVLCNKLEECCNDPRMAQLKDRVQAEQMQMSRSPGQIPRPPNVVSS